jgi:hypothetical protein
MPQPIDINSIVQTRSPVVESVVLVETFVEAQAVHDDAAYQQIDTRRAQLEDAETLRRVRAL